MNHIFSRHVIIIDNIKINSTNANNKNTKSLQIHHKWRLIRTLLNVIAGRNKIEFTSLVADLYSVNMCIRENRQINNFSCFTSVIEKLKFGNEGTKLGLN